MANEITARWHDTGVTLYAQVLDATGQIYNGSTFEVPVDANWGTYDIALTEAGTTRIYRASFPAVAAGVYSLLIYLQAGGSPAVADTLIGLGDMAWSGTAAVLGASGDAVLAAIGALTDLDAADVWSYATRTLTTTTTVLSNIADGDNLTVLRGDSLDIDFVDLGNVAARTKLWFTAKRTAGDTDEAALVQVTEAAGLVRIVQEVAGTPANGDLNVTDAASGDVTLTLAAAETAKLPDGTPLLWDIQMLTAGGVTTLAAGTLTVTADITRAVG